MPEPSPTLNKPCTPSKPNKSKAGLAGIKNPVLPVTSAQPSSKLPVKPAAPVDWVATAKKPVSPKKAERPDNNIRRDDASRLTGFPTTSSLELRIFGLPHFHADDAVNKATKALENINKRNGKLLSDNDPAFVPDTTFGIQPVHRRALRHRGQGTRAQ